jgi:hypothetical protein
MRGWIYLNTIWLLVVLSLFAIPLSARTRMMQRIANGSWGGQGIRLEVSDNSAKVEFDCAHGTIEGPLSKDSQGEFSWKGTFSREHGGPVRMDEKESSENAVYSGTIKGQTMTLDVRLEGQDKPLQTFVLTEGKIGRIRKCL